MAESDFVVGVFIGLRVDDTASESGAEAAGGFVIGDFLLENVCGFEVFVPDGEAFVGDFLQDVARGKVGGGLIEMEDADMEVEGNDAADGFEQVNEEDRIFSAGEGNHDPVAGFDEIPFDGALGDAAREAFLERYGKMSNHRMSISRGCGTRR